MISSACVLDVQQRAMLQLAGQSSAIPEILVQPPREQPHRIAVAQLRSSAEPLVQRAADDPVMIDQCQRFVGDNRFEPIFGRTRAPPEAARASAETWLRQRFDRRPCPEPIPFGRNTPVQ